MPQMTEKLENPFQKTQRFIHFFQVSPIVKVSSRERFAFCVQQTARQDYSTKSLLNRRKKINGQSSRQLVRNCKRKLLRNAYHNDSRIPMFRSQCHQVGFARTSKPLQTTRSRGMWNLGVELEDSLHHTVRHGSWVNSSALFFSMQASLVQLGPRLLLV